MLDKNLLRLEFDKVLNILSNHAISNTAKDMINSLTPSNKCDEIKLNLEKTSLALDLICSKGNIPLDYFEENSICIKKLESSIYLNIKELLFIANVLKTSSNLQDYLFTDTSFDLARFNLMCELFNKLYSNKSISSKITSSIIDENTIADNASPALNKIRKNKKNLESEIRSKLNDFIRSKNSKYLMDNIITIKNDRFAIPIKSEYRDKVPGAILDISSSGSTLYIEPNFVYELNNKINNLKFEENIEIEKILKNLSDLIFPIVTNIKQSLETIYEIDFIFSKAKFAKEIDATLPIINTKKEINLIKARHPLINPKDVVPVDISIGKDYTTLLITGPNAGGKTATLKTLGLLEVMALSGLFIPAKEGSSVYVFDNIFADIGDEQSIQESLSTFSSHITNIVDIIKNATEKSLIILDELGSGTDPIEGASLAISILDYFHKLNALTVATTHYSELKKYALVTDGFENASFEFDIESLSSTYKLLLGIPGKSNAFAISKKLGIPDRIINKAKQNIEKSDIDIENLLKNIYDDKLLIEKEKETIIKNSNQIETLRKSLENDHKASFDKAKEIIENAKSEARDILLDAKEEVNFIIKELEKKNISNKKANELRKNVNKKIDQYSSKKPSDNENKINATDIKVGDIVKIKNLDQSGVVLSRPTKSGSIQVQLGMIKMNINTSDVLSVEKSIKDNNSKNISYINQKSLSIPSEINIIGLNVDEATPIVDKYLDDAYLAGLKSVRIVHGKGTGKLRAGIQSFLKTHTHVKNFRIGTLGEGDMGVTVVEIK